MKELETFWEASREFYYGGRILRPRGGSHVVPKPRGVGRCTLYGAWRFGGVGAFPGFVVSVVVLNILGLPMVLFGVSGCASTCAVLVLVLLFALA